MSRLISMSVIQEALQNKKYIKEMSEYGFDLVLNDKNKSNEYFFVHNQRDLIVLYDKTEKVFYTFPKANKCEVEEQ